MTKHFATSWLQSLSAKLQALSEWSWAADKRGACMTHRNLFREFFSAHFGKTLALVDEAKKSEFLGVIERNLYKFDSDTQQYPLGCLCTLLQHGKDSPQTQEKVVAWVNFLLERLRRPQGGPGVPATVVIAEVVEECLSPQFQKFIPLMEDALRARLADGLGERLGELSEDMQRRVLDQLPAVLARVEDVVVTCTKELNVWMKHAPRFPSTPLTLADTLSKLEHPLVKFFTAVKNAARKEAFMVATALALQRLRTHFRWMLLAEPELESLWSELVPKLFTVEGQPAPVMDAWLQRQLTKYNTEVATKASALLAGNPSISERLRVRLEALFPKVSEDSEEAWLPLAGPTALAATLLEWIRECQPSFVCPEHTLAKETMVGVLQRFSHAFELDLARMRVRLRPLNSLIQPMPMEVQALSATLQPRPLPQVLPLPQAVSPPPPPMAPPPVVPVASAAGTAPGVQPPIMKPPPGAPGAAALALLAGQGPAVPPAAVPAAGSCTALVPTAATGPAPAPAAASLAASLMQLQVPTATTTPAPATSPEVDNLVDLLMREALEKLAPEVRIQINKVGHAIYRMGTKEVTLHTTNGRLFVYRIGEVVRNVPIDTLFQEEGLLPPPATIAAATTSTAPQGTPAIATTSVVDSSAVARITMQSRQLSSGVAVTSSSAPSASVVSHFARKPEAQALMSKRVEAATKAMNISREIVRRSVNLDDEQLVRKLATKGIKKEPQWAQAYQDYCANRGISETDPKKQSRDFVATFVENNLANFINEDWAKEIIYPATKEEKKKKKDKGKKEKKKKDKKRKASDTTSSGDAAGSGEAVGEIVAAGGMPQLTGMPAHIPQGVDPMTFGSYGMPNYGMGMMSMAGSSGMMATLPPGYEGMVGATAVDERAKKKAKKEEKADKSKKDKAKSKK